ncbi:helix-turn-helix domain-containing protein [Mycobacteroides abscessus]|uniref:DNA binding protein n=1 Tax=Mycobacteroides abscessus subsp. abscessus TaxID=1185650 RepID=A0AB38CZP8_9MYCO|nr:helix-turn-helix transcriptional regulator [Mycobacteroides abscessus]SHO87233.1 putative DNA binding protein [Mycobacteroides abscessus subsp. abscessus]SHP06683.1 putative DNA binding protein [Mycobacteroides abscessus subsp. abscessus]SHP19739.1 putative DNA binding protein [Mycobacteroides abscessus subsp. abscessus]SHP38086.1 putative DNA binding protein [Mycobacteroides abscessus subsp. abscessus]SHP45927.1 putative DNA binding protein [Mycobacteroides abscessus subsp. abscessus]
MPPRRAGATTEAVAANIARLRATYKMSLKDLANDLAERGLSITPQSLFSLEKGGTAITVDQLTSVAAVFSVSPVSLLMPWTDDAWEPQVDLAGVPNEYPRVVHDWLVGDVPLEQPPMLEQQNPEVILAFRNRCRPPWMARAEKY